MMNMQTKWCLEGNKMFDLIVGKVVDTGPLQVLLDPC